MVYTKKHTFIALACAFVLALGLFAGVGSAAYAEETAQQSEQATTADTQDTEGMTEGDVALEGEAEDDEPYIAPDAPENAANVAPDEDEGVVVSDARPASRIDPLMVAIPVVIVVIAIVFIVIAVLRRRGKQSA